MITHPLTPEQLRAATSNSRLCYVKAGPGSGKTYLATEAYGYLRYERYRSDPRGVVGVTFARSARAELESRIRVRWGNRSVAWPNAVCTFDELHRRLLRYLVHHGLLAWPSGVFPQKIDDTWHDHPGATGSPGKKTRYRIGLDPEGKVEVFATRSERRAPKPCFVDPAALRAAVRAGYSTHAEVRNVLLAALDGDTYPALDGAVSRCLAGSYCHLIVDESFDMDVLDALVVQRAIDAGVTVTLVGDPWQSLYEFRGASPQRVEDLLAQYKFTRIDMPGSHRYKSAEMQTLARALFDEKPFRVRAASTGDEFDVVLAHDWTTLWDEDRIDVLPVGRPSRLDGSHLANCFVVLLNEVVRENFDREASGVGEARRKLGVESSEGRLDDVLEALREPSVPISEVWAALQAEFSRQGEIWKAQGALARKYMERLRYLACQPEAPGLGLTIHQAKGLEWDRVLLLNGELTTSPAYVNRLNRQHESHRSVYVGVTRARYAVRVLTVTANRYAPSKPEQIERARNRIRLP